MDSIRLEDGQLVVDQDVDVLPLPLFPSIALLDAIFDALPGEDGHVAAICARFTPDDRYRFQQVCEDMGMPYVALWSRAAIMWASVTNDDLQWDLGIMLTCYRRKVGSWLIDTLLVTSSDVWFVINEKGTHTAEEFEYRYGASITSHLTRYIEERKRTIENLVEVVNSPMCDRMVTVVTPDGRIDKLKLHGPSGVLAKAWEIPAGYRYMDEEPCETQNS